MASSWHRLFTRLSGSYSAGVRRKATFFSGRSPRYLGLVAAGGVGAGYFLVSLSAGELELHPPKYPWSHGGLFSALDHQSIRRGYLVYKEVCSACHGMKQLRFKDLIDSSHTTDEAKAFAEEYEYPDEPDKEGNSVMRPGKLSDAFPEPYCNEETARFANNGAFPPDLSLIVLGREGEEDYIFSLLTGYWDKPEGIVLEEGMEYNPYFPGGSIAMPQQLFQDSVEYEDGTPATVSQMAKDVCVFLRWASEPYHDDRKRMGMKALILVSGLTLVVFMWKRRVWSVLKTRKIVYYDHTGR